MMRMMKGRSALTLHLAAGRAALSCQDMRQHQPQFVINVNFPMHYLAQCEARVLLAGLRKVCSSIYLPTTTLAYT